MEDFKALNRQKRAEELVAMGEKPFREKQIFRRICAGAQGFDEMSDLPAKLRETLCARFRFGVIGIDIVQRSSDGTRKYLLAMPDGNKVEAVFMKYSYGNSLCLSTQVGCRMGCRFCASTLGGRIRDLKAWELLDEYIVCRRDAGEPINHIVLMGIGEPFDNYENVAEFLRQIHDPQGIGLSYRNITVSTCGRVPEIRRFGEEFPQVNLAISLHAATQQEREAIMPIARQYDLDTLLSACREHAEKTGRRVSFEYTLIKGRNDSPAHAEQLASLLSGMLCHVNLIPLNPVAETGLQRTDKASVYAFQKRLEVRGIPATVRRGLGGDIDAACGQLRNKN